MVTIGHDAEVFVAVNGHVTSAIGLIGGTKDKPLPVKMGGLQEDNVLAELNITPATSADAFIGNTEQVLAELKAMLPPDYDVVIASSHTYEKTDILSFGKQAVEFGCTPDFNCWSLDENDSPSPYTLLRTAGGHIHIGFDDGDVVTTANIVDTIRMCDYMLGLPSVLLDGDTQRRSLYGQAGAYREKAYGCEYRTLSNFWMKDKDLMRWVYNQAREAYLNRDEYKNMRGILVPSELQRIINTSDVDAASEYVQKLGLVLP
jgi:hypothetical protein